MLGISKTGGPSSPASSNGRSRALMGVIIAAVTLLVVVGCRGAAPSPAAHPSAEPVTHSIIPMTARTTRAASSPTVPATQTASPPTVEHTAPPLDQPLVEIGEASFSVELALTDEQRFQGLSDRDSLDAGTGMLFILEEERTVRFWMKDMRIPLDMLWVAADCHLVGINSSVPVPPPGTPQKDLLRYGPGQEAKYVLEINAGEAAAFGIETGGKVVFAGAIAGEYGC